MKRLMVALVVLVSAIELFFIAGGLGVSAQAFKTGDSAFVRENETVDSSLITASNTVTIAGTVNGDLFCAGQTVTISGTVNGDVICAAQVLEVSGTVNGDVRIAGQTVTMNGSVTRNATIFAQTATTTSSSKIAKDVAGGIQTATLNGTIGRDVLLGSETLTINNVIGRNVTSKVTTVTLGSNATINGNLEYTSPNEANKSPKATVEGKITRKTPPETEQTSKGAFGLSLLSVFLYMFVALLVTALAVTIAIPGKLQAGSDYLLANWQKTFLVGLASHIIVPTVILFLIITVFGIPLAVLLTLVWWVVFILCGPFAAYAVGRMILKNKTPNAFWYMIVGSIIILLLYWLPLINLFVFLAVGVMGVGMVLQAFTPVKPQYSFASTKIAHTKKIS